MTSGIMQTLSYMSTVGTNFDWTHCTHTSQRSTPKTATGTEAMYIPPNAVNVFATDNNSWQFQSTTCYDHVMPTAAQVPSNLVTTIQGIKLHLVTAINL